MEIFFIYPKYLYLIFSVPLIIFIHFISLRISKRKALRFANFDALAKIKGIDIYSKNIMMPFFFCLLVIFLALSIAGIGVKMERQTSSSSFVIAIDSSRSMESNDLMPTRIEAAKETASNFVENSKINTRFSVISFSTTAKLEQAITDDKEILLNAIDSVGLSNSGGTNVYGAVVLGSDNLKNEESKVIILLSDGQINIGTLEETIDYANENKVIVHSVAIGTLGGGNASYGISKLDEESLKALAFNTGGSFFRVQDRENLASSLEFISGLEIKKVSIELSSYLALISIALIVFIYYMINTRYRIFP